MRAKTTPTVTGPALNRGEWKGLALLALYRCGLSGKEIQAVLSEDDAGVVRWIWSCASRGPAG
jgi:hypothetical protein